MKIKAAVFDIDGTLVPYGAPGPSQAAVQALRELAQSGVAVVIATGRARYTAQWVLGSGIKPDYFAAVNGADVTDAAGRPVWQSRMTPEEMYALVDFCEDHELPLEFIFSDAYYVYVEYAAFVEKYCGQNAASGFFDSVLRDGEDQVRHLQDMPFGACAAMDARHAAAFEAKYGHLGLRFIP
ncbi:MAG: HAD family hydrolase, partial [Ruthenibacterium lactatiformans]